MISPLTPSHAALLHALEAEAYSGASPQQLSDALSDTTSQVVGFWQQNGLMGYAMVARLPFDAELQAIAVLPACQGQGIGRQLLGEVIACAEQWKSERLLLEVRASNQPAIRLYQQHGFSEDGRRRHYYPAVQGATGREDALLMSRPC